MTSSATPSPAETAAPRATLTPKKLYRIVAIAEAITWTLLITGLILRATAGLDIAVTIGGSIHGFVFLAYGATAVLTAINQRWSVGLSVLAVVTAVIPYATIPFDIWAHRTGKLEGDWRREATDDPRDQRWFDRLVRWMLNHPYLLAALILLAVVALFTVLLILGPPVPKA
jgi:integral membrane protein